MRIATVEQMKKIEAAAMGQHGIPSACLMERAAQALALAVKTRLEATGGTRVTVFAGPGNNGGDGLAAARLLLQDGYAVRAVLVGRRDSMTGNSREMAQKLQAAGGKLEDFTEATDTLLADVTDRDVLVDALFGTGLNTPVQGQALAAVKQMNASPAATISADMASGVEADTGLILGGAVRAEETVVFTLLKVGNLVDAGGICCGRLTVADIGIPPAAVDAETYLTFSVGDEDVVLPRKPRDAHKGQFGRVYILGGSAGYTGAPVFSAQGAIRTGAGLVTVGVPAPVWPVVATKLDEAMVQPLPAGKEGLLSVEATEIVLERISACDVCLIGPGLGRSNGVAAVVRYLLKETHLPVVLDADGINALEGHIDSLDGRRGALTVLTPHDMEFTRLGGDLSHGDRLQAARAFSAEHGCALMLKGHHSITAFPDGTAYINTAGNPGMAKGGSGDVLAGMIVSLIGQGIPARQAIIMAVYLHAKSGDLCAEELGEYAMTPMDIIARLPRTLKQFEALS